MPNTDILDAAELATILDAASDADRAAASEALNETVGSLVKAVAGATLTLTDADHGYLLSCAAACVITVPAGLRSDFSCGWVQAGASQITFEASGTTIREPDDYLKSEQQWASGGLTALAEDVYLLMGRTGA